MDDLDKKIFEANQRNIAENMNFSESQIAELKAIIRNENKDILDVTQKYKNQSDYLAAKNDPSKKNFDQYCELGAKAIDQSSELTMALKHADNKINFMYEVGQREAAFRAQQQKQPNYQQYTQQAQQQAQQQAYAVPEYQVNSAQPNYAMTPEPQQGAAPYSGNIDPAAVPWGNLPMSEFEKLTIAMGNTL